MRSSQKGRLGILAGAGELPWIVAKNAVRAGEKPVLFTFTQDPAYPVEGVEIVPVRLTRFYTSVLRAFRSYKIDRLVSIGKATRDILYHKPKFDLRTILLLARMENHNDTTIFRWLLRIIESKGIQVLEQTEYLQDAFLKPGRYGKKLTKQQLEDVIYGFRYAREINRLDIGQSVVVGKKYVLAVEAAEGTDRCIERGGTLFRSPGAVVCKVAKINHDKRFDIPATGLTTLDSMAKSGCTVLAIEADCTFVVHQKQFIEEAKKRKITILSVDHDFTSQKHVEGLNRRETKLS